MNHLLNRHLQSLPELKVGNAEERTPALNIAAQLLADIEDSHNALQALMLGAPLPGCSARVWTGYWVDLALGTQLSRRSNARALRERNFTSKARLLYVYRLISDGALAAILDAFTSAERLSEGAWGASGDEVAVLSAVSIETDPGCVLVVPALERALFEFDDRQPSRALPGAVGENIHAALRADYRRQKNMMTFASIGPDVARHLVDEKLLACEEAILACIGDDPESAEHQQYRHLHQELRGALSGVLRLFRGIDSPDLPANFWTYKRADGMTTQLLWAERFTEALDYEAQLQVYEKTLSETGLDLLKHALSQPAAAKREHGATQVLEVSVGSDYLAWTLPGAFVMVTREAVANPGAIHPVVFLLVGEEGGLREFPTLQALSDCLRLSLADPGFSPLWGRFSGKARAALQLSINQAPLALRLPVIEENWLRRCFVTQVERCTEEPDGVEMAPLNRRLQRSLACARNEVRDLSIDRIAEQRRVQAQLLALPDWLLSAGEPLRSDYSNRLEAFNQAAAAQEQRLQEELPLLPVFIGTILKARIKADLGEVIDPESVGLDIPDEVRVVTSQNKPTPQYKLHGQMQALSIIELAMLDIDPQVSLRLKFAQRVGRVAMRSRLTKDYLRTLIAELDVVQPYRDAITQVFSVAPDSADVANLRTQLLLTPYRLALEMEAFCLYHQGKLSAAAQASLGHAIAARESAELRGEGFDVRLYKVRLEFGGSDQDLFSSLLLIEDRCAELCCLYLPNVPAGPVLIEGASRAQVLDALLDRLSDPQTCAWLAGQGGIVDATPAREAYLNDARLRKFAGFVECLPCGAPIWPLAAAMFEARKQRLLENTRSASRTRKEVGAAFKRQLRDSGERILVSGLGYLPGINTMLQRYDGWTHPRAGVNAFQEGDVAIGLRRLASVELNIGFVLKSFIAEQGAVRQVREAVRARRGMHRTQPLPVRPQPFRPDDFPGYEVDVSLVGAKVQSGLDAGVWMHNGKLYLWQNRKVYEVFRRPGEHTLRLHPTARRGYAQPLRRGADGLFLIHRDVGGNTL